MPGLRCQGGTVRTLPADQRGGLLPIRVGRDDTGANAGLQQRPAT
jgi:hypothetical protein